MSTAKGAFHQEVKIARRMTADATGGSDPNLVIAALLHDAIEDCEVPGELIAETFGEDVARLVEEVTDDSSEGSTKG
jgi:(p)ppGpp synthase/HD superfamily hydrolase